MSEGERVVPSRMNLQIFKGKKEAADKGYDLLKKKNDALKLKFREIMGKLIESKKNLGEMSSEAFLLVAKSQWAAEGFQQKVMDAVSTATIRLNTKEDNVAGVKLPAFKVREIDDGDDQIGKIGIYGGAITIQKTREKFKELLGIVVDIASLQTSFLTLDRVIKITSRRVNALEHVVIPRYKGVIAYIKQELDEQAREEKFTLKKVLENKVKLAELEALVMGTKVKEIKEANSDDEGDESNLLQQEDDDIIF